MINSNNSANSKDQESQSISNISNNNGNVVYNASTPISLDSPSNSFAVSQANVSNIQSEIISGLSNLCSHQTMSHGINDEGVLSQEFKTRLWSLFRQIEAEFERECKKIYNETYAMPDRNEKIESSDHEEANIAKKISSSHFSQKIKQQYKQSKQSTSRLVSTFRDRGSTMPTISGGQSNYQLNRRLCGLCWRTSDHRDGIWDVNCIGRGLVGSASADGCVRLWTAETGHCSFCYLGHSGSVNSVRFKGNVMLTASGDGTAHWLALPADKVAEAMALVGGESGNKSSVSDNCMTGGPAGGQSETRPTEEDGGDPVTPTDTGPTIMLRNPDALYQTASLLGHYQESASLSAADFLSGRDQIVTAGWDRLGRIYDVATGSEVASLTGHDLPLTDVRTSPMEAAGHSLAVTSSKDCTFRLWDFRCSSTEVHVQQGHNGVVSSVSFLGDGGGQRLVSAGADRMCKVWDLRQARNPLHVIRTDSPINRLAVHPQGRMVALPMDNRGVKIFDLALGTRITRLPRANGQSHSRIVTNVTWTADGGGKPNFFSVGFDHNLMAWNMQIPAGTCVPLTG